MPRYRTAAEVAAAFDEVFDQAVVFHGFADYMRDYDVIVYATADPRTGIRPEFLRYRFTMCVRADVTTAVSEQTWARSLDDRLVELETGVHLDGYVWGVAWQALYPGMSLVEDSVAAARWATALGIPFHEARIETNGHDLTLLFSELDVVRLDPGWSPFTVEGDDPAGTTPLP